MNFIFIHKTSDYIYVPLINPLGFIAAGVLVLWIVFKDLRINFQLEIKFMLLLLGLVTILLFISSNVIIEILFGKDFQQSVVIFNFAYTVIVYIYQYIFRIRCNDVYPYNRKFNFIDKSFFSV